MPKISIYNKKSQKEEISEAPQVEELLKNLEFHKAIQSITNRINSAVTLREIVVDIKEDIRKLFNIHILTIYLIDKEKKEIFTLQSNGAETKEVRFPIDRSTFAGYAAQKKKMLYIADAYNEQEIRRINDVLKFDQSPDKTTGITTGQIIASPILHDGAVLGVMEIMNKKDGETIDDYNQIFLDEIAGCLAKSFFRQLDFVETSQKYYAKLNKLIREGIITSGQMDKALKEAFATKEDPITILMERYDIPKSTIGAALADHFSCPFTAYNDDMPVVHDLLAGIEKSTLINMLWIPLKVVQGKIQVLIEDPSDHAKKLEIEEILETNSIQYIVALATDILKLIDRSYAKQEDDARADGKFGQMPQERSFPQDEVASTRSEADKIITHPDTKIARKSMTFSEPEPEVAPQNKVIAAPETETASAVAPEPPPAPEPEPPAQNLSKSKAEPQEAKIIAAEMVPPRDIHQMAKSKNILEKADVVISKPEIPIFPSLTNIIYEACGRHASDIHFEPDPMNKNVTLRIRIDGQCLTRQILTCSEYEKVIDEVKILANLDVKNRAIIQNGKLKLKRPSGDEINMRVAFIPTQAGMEDTVIHISSIAKKIPLELLGLSEDNYADLVNILRQPRGLVFIVGPAGSGITTTLHACLDNINTPDKKIWTAEEPVEITQNGLRQVQIDPRKGFDFPTVVRSFLNADPDVIMASRADDLETANICMEAAIKGRLVLSAIRAENILDTIEKCLDMEIDHLVFADAMLSIMAQRLIKTLCPKCKEKYHPSHDEYEELVQIYGKDAFDKLNIPYSNNFSLFRPKGCDDCGQTGYRGRMCVSEICVFTPQIKRMIRRKESPQFIYQTAVAQGMTTLLQDGITKVLQGHSDNRHVRLTCLK